MKAYNRQGEPVELADGEILPDGFSIHVPSFLVDGIPQAMTTENVIADSAGRPAGSRPGFLLDANKDNDAAARIAYDAMVARNQSSWRSPHAATPISDATTPEASREAYIKHTENSWRTPNNQVQARDAYGGHVTFPGGDKSQDDLNAAREQAYEDMVKRNEAAWKNTGGVKFGYGF